MADTITYYDFSNLLYSSFFLAGFARNEESFRYTLAVSRNPPKIPGIPSTVGKWSELLSHIGLFRITTKNHDFFFCIDFLDSSKSFNAELLQHVKFYFKVNYNPDHVRSDSALARYGQNIVPAPFFFPIRTQHTHLFLPRLLQAPRGGNIIAALNRLNLLRNLVGLHEMIRWRTSIEKDLDLFFVQRYYGENVHSESMEFRYQLIRALRQCRGISVVAGFARGKEPLRGKFAEFTVEETKMRPYLKNLARARVSIYVRGAHDCLSFKLGQQLALGKPIVGQTVANSRDRIYRHNLLAEQFAYEEPDQMVQQVLRLLKDDGKREELSRANAAVFDQAFAPHLASAEILNQLLT